MAAEERARRLDEARLRAEEEEQLRIALHEEEEARLRREITGSAADEEEEVRAMSAAMSQSSAAAAAALRSPIKAPNPDLDDALSDALGGTAQLLRERGISDMSSTLAASLKAIAPPAAEAVSTAAPNDGASPKAATAAGAAVQKEAAAVAPAAGQSQARGAQRADSLTRAKRERLQRLLAEQERAEVRFTART